MGTYYCDEPNFQWSVHGKVHRNLPQLDKFALLNRLNKLE